MHFGKELSKWEKETEWVKKEKKKGKKLTSATNVGIFCPGKVQN